MRVAFFALLVVNFACFAWANWIDAAARSPAGAARQLPQLPLASETDIAPAAPPRCVSVGPFEDLADAAHAAATLKERGFPTRQRAEEGAGWTGYWVYVGGFKGEQDQTRALRRLERGGITDAHVMPASGETRRISLGVFSERARADRRAAAAVRAGMKPEIGERTQSGAVYWIDFDLTARDSAIAAEGLLSTNASGSRIEIRGCPAAIERPVLANSPG
jgi:hypothetical protein